MSIDSRGGMSILNFSIDVLAGWACRMANRSISPEEWYQYVGNGKQYDDLCSGR
jgi:hypothetical protein